MYTWRQHTETPAAAPHVSQPLELKPKPSNTGWLNLNRQNTILCSWTDTKHRQICCELFTQHCSEPQRLGRAAQHLPHKILSGLQCCCRGRRVCPNAGTGLGGAPLAGLLVGSGTLSHAAWHCLCHVFVPH